MLWLSFGFISMGSVGAEIDAPAKTLPKVALVLLPLTTMLNILPLAMAISLDNNHENFEPGQFDALASKYYGAWLGWMFLVGAIFCQVGQLNAGLVTAQRILYRFMQLYFPEKFIERRTSRLFHALWINDEAGVPRGVILLTNAVAMFFVWIPLNVLVESSVLLSCPGLVLMNLSYIILKRRNPSVFPFRRWLARPVCFSLMALIPSACILAQAGLSVYDDEPVFGLPYFKLIVFVIVVGTTYLVHLLYHLIVGPPVPDGLRQETVALLDADRVHTPIQTRKTVLTKQFPNHNDFTDV